MTYFLGPVITDQRRVDLPPDVLVKAVPYHTAAYDQPPPLMRGGANINMAKIMSGIVADTERNAMIVDLIAAALNAGRKVLCLSDRRAHCSTLLQQLQARCPGKKACLYLGGMKAEQLAEAAAIGDVLLATYGLASEGLDIPTLDTLVMCTPRSSIEQAVGRVLRGAPNPLIIDILDRFCVCYAQFNKRRTYYDTCGFRVALPVRQDDSDDDTNRCLLVSDDDDE
jgi:hypothetical protein